MIRHLVKQNTRANNIVSNRALLSANRFCSRENAEIDAEQRGQRYQWKMETKYSHHSHSRNELIAVR